MTTKELTVRDMIRAYQREIRDTSDLLPDRAAELLTKLTALLGNCADEIRNCDHDYSVVLLAHLETEKHANRARIKAEISPAFQRRQEARDLKDLSVEMIRSLKYYLRAKGEELQLSRHL
jgi:hypothetical protein